MLKLKNLNIKKKKSIFKNVGDDEHQRDMPIRRERLKENRRFSLEG
jgi:hypothetical protein